MAILDTHHGRRYPAGVLLTGLPGGGFIPCTESGIPAMKPEKVDRFVKYLADALAKYRSEI